MTGPIFNFEIIFAEQFGSDDKYSLKGYDIRQTDFVAIRDYLAQSKKNSNLTNTKINETLQNSVSLKFNLRI